MRLAHFAAATAAVMIIAPATAGAATLAPHRAIYDLTLRETRKPNAIERVQGRMVYEFTGNACEGYTSNARQVTELLDPEGQTTQSDLRSTSWEDAAGKTYKFSSKTFNNRTLGKEIDGSAVRLDNGSVEVKAIKPAAKTMQLAAPVLFPTQHTREIIGKAEAGASTLSAQVFDGASDVDKLYATLTVIGQKVGAETSADLEQPARQGALAASPRWPIRVSYFDAGEQAKSGESTPLYTMGFELYDNGVSRALRIDYGDFVLDGTLKEIEFLPVRPCPPAP